MNYDLYWVWLSLGLGAGASCLDLVTYFEWNPYEIYGSTFNEIFSLNVLNKTRIEKLKSFPIEKAEKILRVSKENGPTDKRFKNLSTKTGIFATP